MKWRVFLLLASTLALFLSAGCGEETIATEEPESVEFQVHFLESTCSSTGAPKGIDNYRVKIVDRTTNPPLVIDDREFNSSETSLKMNGIPQGSNLELTVLGMAAGDTRPVLYGRARNLLVTKNVTTSVDMTLSRYADFSCLDLPPSAANMMFPTVTSLPDGRVLIAGGFTKVKEDSGRFEIFNPSDRAYIYDPTTGEFRQAQNLMNHGRAAHAAIYMPHVQKVLLVGGVDRLYLEKSQAKFPWYWLKESAGTVGRTYELFDTTTEQFQKLDIDWPDETDEMVNPVRRVFPALAYNNDGTVLVTGGGQWKSVRTQMETDPDYQIAEIYAAALSDKPGGFMETFGALTMRAMRSGHQAALLDVKDKLAYHIFWGGNADGPIAEVYIESSDQVSGNFGLFKELEFLDDNTYSSRPFFHTFTPLGNREFLLVGGALYKDNNLQPPKADHAFVVRVNDELRVGVSKVDGLTEGRYFHSTMASDTRNIVVVGGFTAAELDGDTIFATAATDDMRFFDATNRAFVLPPVDSKPLPRAGFGAVALSNDCFLMVGGVDEPSAALEYGSSSIGLVAEQFCPSLVCREATWESACYTE